MSKKSRIVVMFLIAAFGALSLCAVPAAMAKSQSWSKALRFTVVKRTPHYDVVSGHHRRFAVRHGAHNVIIRGAGRCRVVRRTHDYVYLRETSHGKTATPTLVSPNSGGFALGVSTTITWRMSAAVSTGYYRVSLENIVNGASTGLTATRISARTGETRYSVPWNVTQAVGTYTLSVDYCSNGGEVIGSDVSDGPLSILPAPTPTPSPTPTGIPAGAFNVMHYGAKADGVTDDSPYIQAAVNACYYAGGGTVYMPAGTYLLSYSDSSWAPPGIHGSRNNDCSDSIDLLDNVTIRGAGTGQTYVKGMRLLSNVFGATLRSNIGVKDMTIYGGIASPNFDGVKFYACRNAAVDNVVAHDLYIGLALYSCIDSTIANSVAYTCSGMGFTASESFKDYAQLCSNNVVSDCEAYACMDGFTSKGQYPKVGYPRNERCNGTTFLRCNSHDNTRFGFLAGYAGRLTMTDSVAEGNTSLNVLLGGVQTGNLHNSASATVDTPSTPSWGWMCDNYGLCSDIVVN